MSNSIKENGNMEARGAVKLSFFRYDNEGNKEYFDYYDKDNLIVEVGRSVVVDLIVGESNKQLTYIEWGRGGAPKYPDGDPLIEYDVKDTDIELGDSVLKKALNPHERVSPTSIRYVETLISDEVNSNINEAALIFRDRVTGEETLFAKITFPTVSLLVDKGFGVELSWTINFRKILFVNEEGAE